MLFSDFLTFELTCVGQTKASDSHLRAVLSFVFMLTLASTHTNYLSLYFLNIIALWHRASAHAKFSSSEPAIIKGFSKFRNLFFQTPAKHLPTFPFFPCRSTLG